MAEETLGYVELEWVCEHCNRRNPGTQKVCAGCGKAISARNQFQAPAQQQFITDPSQLARSRHGARRRVRTKKVRRTQSEPAPGAEKVCEKPQMVDQGNGTAKVVQKCEYKISDSWCEYTTSQWQDVDKAVARGTDLSPQWPPVRLRAGQREGARSEDYEVTFKSGGAQYTYDAKDAADLSRFSAGSQWTLKVNSFDSVNEVLPVK